MKAKWEISEAALDAWRLLVEQNKDKKLVLKRLARNIQRKDIDLSEATIWRVLVGCQVTTLERSGPDSKVDRFLDEGNANPSGMLSYRVCQLQSNRQAFLESELRAAGFWRARPIAANLAKITQNLEAGEWASLLAQLRTLEKCTTKSKERAVALYLQSKSFPGMGPKQSRNCIQWLGLARYEVPIDSRVVQVLRQHGSNFVPKSAALGDETVYVFVQDALQEIASRIEIYPCILDASIFASLDSE